MVDVLVGFSGKSKNQLGVTNATDYIMRIHIPINGFTSTALTCNLCHIDQFQDKQIKMY